MKILITLLTITFTLNASPSYEEFYFSKQNVRHKVVIDNTLKEVRVSTFTNGCYTGKVMRMKMDEFDSYTNKLVQSGFDLTNIEIIDNIARVNALKKKQDEISKQMEIEYVTLNTLEKCNERKLALKKWVEDREEENRKKREQAESEQMMAWMIRNGLDSGFSGNNYNQFHMQLPNGQWNYSYSDSSGRRANWGSYDTYSIYYGNKGGSSYINGQWVGNFWWK